MLMRLIREWYASEIIGVAELRDRHAERSPLFPRCVEREIDLARERLGELAEFRREGPTTKF